MASESTQNGEEPKLLREYLRNMKPEKVYSDPDWMVDYKGCRIHYPFNLNVGNMETFQARSEDVCVITFPKCGTTWMSAIVYMIINKDDPDSLTTGKPIKMKVPYLEMTSVEPPKNPSDKPLTCIEHLNAQKSPRLYGTHFNALAMPHSVLGNAKIIYVYRNPKDALVSNHFYMKSAKMYGFYDNLEHLLQTMIDDKCIFAPFFEHIEGFWERRNEPNVFVTSFEELAQAPREVIMKVAQFLGKDITETQLDNICHHCHFDRMKNNDLANMSDFEKPGWLNRDISPFIRKGQVGNWKQHLTVDQSERLDAWIAKNSAERPGLTGLKFRYA